ncbi:MAG: hypothetical protein Q7S96_02100 [bacterium]|nr:hypothetical protein [bacterium]
MATTLCVIAATFYAFVVMHAAHDLQERIPEERPWASDASSAIMVLAIGNLLCGIPFLMATFSPLPRYDAAIVGLACSLVGTLLMAFVRTQQRTRQ